MYLKQFYEWMQSNMLYLEIAGLVILLVVLLFILLKFRRDRLRDKRVEEAETRRYGSYNFSGDEESHTEPEQPKTEESGRIGEERGAEIAGYPGRQEETYTQKSVPEENRVEEESYDSSSVQSQKAVLSVHRQPIPETPNIDRISFSEFEGKKILVAEDSLINQKLLATLLSHTGIELAFAGNGKVALEKIMKNKSRFDLVLMDVNMPELDGLEATKKIRRDVELDDLPIVALTASTDKHEVEKIISSGMNGYLDKPIVLGKMYTAFKLFLKDYARNKGTVQRSGNMLDTAHGIEHSMGDMSLYRSILEDFLKQYEGSADLFVKLVKGKHFTELKKMIIDLMGLSGTIGALSIYDLLEKSNRALIYGNQEMLPELARDFNREFKKLIKEIREYLE